MKRTWALIIITFILLSMTGCNRQMLDRTYHYDHAIICLPNGEMVEGEVSSWRDFEDCDQIQVKVDGVTYLVHSSMIALISDYGS